ncbi:hypothetical protein J1614_010965 [Plenodomus biglobosus]|nr:hypothetical protein J1614_010965 [Plenodomus biglobosus]
MSHPDFQRLTAHFFSPLEAARLEVKEYEDEANYLFQMWKDCQSEMEELGECAMYEFFVNSSLKFNLALKEDLLVKPLRECLLKIIRLQKEARYLEQQTRIQVCGARKAHFKFLRLLR